MDNDRGQNQCRLAFWMHIGSATLNFVLFLTMLWIIHDIHTQMATYREAAAMSQRLFEEARHKIEEDNGT